MLGLMVGGAPYALFGDVFLRDYFYAMDKVNNKVGLYGLYLGLGVIVFL